MTRQSTERRREPLAERARRAALPVACLWLACLVGCKNTNFISTREEVAMGRQAVKEIGDRYRVDVDTPDAKRVQRIGDRLLLHNDTRPGVPYRFFVLDMKEVNAVSLPGGPIYVFRGLLDMVDDDDQLAGVMGHELAHIDARHAAKQISQQMLTNVGIMFVFKGATSQNLAGVASDLLGLSYSRDDEFESDRRGVSYLAKAGYDPRGMVTFFRKLGALEKKGGSGGPEWLRTHPMTSRRIDRIEKLIETHDYRYGR